VSYQSFKSEIDVVFKVLLLKVLIKVWIFVCFRKKKKEKKRKKKVENIYTFQK